MGFAWSSFLAQSTLLAKCFAGGLTRNQVLSDDHLSPYSTRLNFALATDDLLVFARGNQRVAHHHVACVDVALTKAGIVPHVGKMWMSQRRVLRLELTSMMVCSWLLIRTNCSV